MITVLDNPIVKHNLAILRDKNTSSADFRACAKRISIFLAYEAFLTMPLTKTIIETPMEKHVAEKVKEPIVFVPVLRAGLALLDGFRSVYPDAATGFIGLKRNEKTFEAEQYYFSCPKILPETKFYILEMMIATGGSTCDTVSRFAFEGAENITVCSIISAPEGIERLRTEHPTVKIITASLDRELSQNKYILPGLGDAGDRWSGELL